jgi:hypothetical protein
MSSAFMYPGEIIKTVTVVTSDKRPQLAFRGAQGSGYCLIGNLGSMAGRGWFDPMEFTIRQGSPHRCCPEQRCTLQNSRTAANRSDKEIHTYPAMLGSDEFAAPQAGP